MGYYYITSGVTSTGITLYDDSMYVYSGGTANSTTVDSYGYMYISSGGVANRTTVKSGGDMYISSGGVANSTTVNDGGYMEIDCGGVANSTTVNDGGRIFISSGGTATNVVWTPCVGGVNAAAGACVTYASAYSGVYFGSSNQLLSHTQSMTGKEVSSGSIYVMSNGVANNTTVDYGGSMYISSGGTANSTTVNDGGYMYISSGGVANSTTVNSWGCMRISSGGVANSTTINDWGNMYISSGGTATDIVASAGASLEITVAPDTYIQGTYAGSAFEMKDAQITEYTVNSWGCMRISSGGVANSTTVNKYGSMYISSGGVANSTTVHSRGTMYIYSGGTATNVVWTPCVGNVSAADGACVTYASAYSGVYFGSNDQLLSHTQSMTGKKVVSGSMYVMSNGVANSTTVNGGRMYISSGGVANSITLNSGGSMYISSGGVANSTTINDWGNMYISSGGVANSITLNSGGSMYISSGGVANSITLKSGGYMEIYAGGTATDINWTPFITSIYVADGAYVTYASQCTGVYLGNYGQLLSSALTMNNKVVSDTMYVLNRGTVNSTTLNGWMYIYSGGVANSTTVNAGMYIYSGGVANSTTVNAWMVISSGGVANGTTVNSGGYMYIDGVANSTTTTTGCWIFISSGGVTNSTTVNGGQIFIYSGGVANSTTVNSGGGIGISGGVANSTTVNSGSIFIYSGGVANSTTINSGNMNISSGGVHRGSLQIAGGATVSAYAGAKIDFTVADRTVEDGYLINDLSRISGTPTYTITVSADQASGEYKLAQGAANFTGTITIGNGTDEYGALTVNGDTLFCNNRNYILKLDDGNLTLDIFRDAPDNLRGSADGISWTPAYDADGYWAQYRFDNMTAALNVYTSSTAVDTYNLPGKSNFWRVCVAGGDWSESLLVSGTKQPTQPLMMQSDADGDTDLFFARANGKWGESYAAEHQGIKDVWNGIGKKVQLTGKNKLEDVFVGSTDANILVLTDDANGDALFVDDIYSAFPDEVEAQARITQINEIRAGAGDDVIDLTSQQFEYIGDGVTVYGGLGNDVIWANSGENHLFGDAGNDRIVGGSDKDVIVGGAGNDSMHGGGGNDTFCFGSDWGKDTIEQLADGSVTLWFESGSEDFWNAEAMIYTDGVNKVIIKGVTADAVSLRFGDVESAIAGAFENAASEKIFEDQDKALIA